MDFIYRFGDKKIRIASDEKAEYIDNTVNPEKPDSFEINLDSLYMAYQMFPSNIKSYIDAFGSLFFREPQIQMYDDITNIPNAIPATGNDIYNYMARYGMANYQIQAVLKFNSRLDPIKLMKAVSIANNIEPVFGCRFIENQPPYWLPLSDTEKRGIYSFEETNNTDEAVRKFLESPLDMDKDPMVKVKLISSGAFDTLCLKINHTCTDGSGVKEYIHLLSDIYCSIDQNRECVHRPRIRSRADQDKLLNNLGITDLEAARDPKSQVPKTVWPFCWKVGIPGDISVSVCKIPRGYLGVLSDYAKARGATMNDMILTGYYRAMFELSKPPYGIPMDISMTVDLRRYLPNQKTEAIRNFSGGFLTRLPRIMNEPFGDTLSRVVNVMKQVKSGTPGLQSALGLEHIEKGDFYGTLSFYENISKVFKLCSGFFGFCNPILSNMGFIDKSLLRFGESYVTDAYIIPPALCAPGILLCVGSYNNEITLTISYYKEHGNSNQIQKLLDLIRSEMIDGCRS